MVTDSRRNINMARKKFPAAWSSEGAGPSFTPIILLLFQVLTGYMRPVFVRTQEPPSFHHSRESGTASHSPSRSMDC